MKILIASDVHCGYGENKKYLCDDSFENFEEVLQKAKQFKADFILLGGDLFHENQPSRDSQLRVVRLIRKYSLNGPKSNLEVISNGDKTFSSSEFKHANIEDENLLVSMPIFTIHGNHDDLSGKVSSSYLVKSFQGQTVIDLLHESGLVNLFGKFENIDKFHVYPVLLRKVNEDGSVDKVALYGISSQRDDRLARAFIEGKVKFHAPDDVEDYLNILVLHQNRPLRSTVRTTGSYIPTDLLPGFVDLVVWGHEHLSIPDLEKVNTKCGRHFYILQPGSTVVTSICPDESAPKNCFLLDTKCDHREPRVETIQLLTPRQVYYEECDLDLAHLVPPCEDVRLKDMEDERYLHRRICEILADAQLKRNDTQPELPLIRIRVVYNGVWRNIPPLNARKFGANYVDRVANPLEIITTKICRRTGQTRRANNDVELDSEEPCHVTIDERIRQYFKDATGEDRLNVLQPEALELVLEAYNEVTSSCAAVERGVGENISELLRSHVEKIRDLSQQGRPKDAPIDYKDLEERVEKCIRQRAAEKSHVDTAGSCNSSPDHDSADLDILLDSD